MIIKNEDIREVIVEVPEGHRHIRTIMRLKDGSEFVFQEAAVANIVRAYVTVKTHPVKKRVVQVNQRPVSRKKGYAEWQLLESEGERED